MKIPIIDPTKLPARAQERLALEDAQIIDEGDDGETIDPKMTSEDFYRYPDGRFWRQRKRPPKEGEYIPLNQVAKKVGMSRQVLQREISNRLADKERELKLSSPKEIGKLRQFVYRRKTRKQIEIWISRTFLRELFPAVNWN
jgi:hypothetical protein